MKKILLLAAVIVASNTALAQTSPAPEGYKPAAASTPKVTTDTIDFEQFNGGDAVTNQTIPKGAIFSPIGTADPKVYDYGVGTYGKVLISDTWYDPVRVDFVDSVVGTNPAFVQKIELENPIDVEVDYLVVDVYDENDVLLHHYVSASPEYITIDLGTPQAAYMILDDSLNTAYVVDNILLDFGPQCMNTTSTITTTELDTYTAPSGAIHTMSGVFNDTIPNAEGCDSIITIDLTMQYTGLDENSSVEVKVYPSPASETITIAINEGLLEESIQIVDQMGRVVMIGKLEELSNVINVSQLDNGIYYIHVGETRSVKFIKAN